jgi:2-polyprenyl-3-methyl-5-hydroxy-6-metoxy-1,4-benzoquinol methylase
MVSAPPRAPVASDGIEVGLCQPCADVPSSKPADYYSVARIDMVPLLPDPLGRVLDVGCGSGATGRLLRGRNPDQLVGIEIDPAAGRSAQADYDQVLIGPVERVLDELGGQFDTILLYDVLEHLTDPWDVLRRLARIAAPQARLHVSVPNARHLSLMVDVMLRGTFGYTSYGHRDDTHLRWFTPRDIETAVTRAGFEIRHRSHPAISRPRRVLGRLTGGRSTEFVVWQWQVLAVHVK